MSVVQSSQLALTGAFMIAAAETSSVKRNPETTIRDSLTDQTAARERQSSGETDCRSSHRPDEVRQECGVVSLTFSWHWTHSSLGSLGLN